MAPDSGLRSPVLSLTVIDGSTLHHGRLEADSQVLAVVRHEDTNPTHPNVVSVPTQRLPRSLYDDLLASAQVIGEDASVGAQFFEGGTVDNGTDNGHYPIIYALEALLARKLGLAEALERGDFGVRAALRARVDGVAVYETTGMEPTYEKVSMLNVVVEIGDGRAQLPIRTSSYSLMAWADVLQFIDGVRSRDPTTISPTLDSIDLCVHGVCLMAAEASLSNLLGHPPLDGDALKRSSSPRAGYAA